MCSRRVRKAGHRVRVTAQLVMPPTVQLWSERYDSEIDDFRRAG